MNGPKGGLRQPGAIRVETQGLDKPLIFLHQLGDQGRLQPVLPAFQAPELHFAILAAGRQAPAIRAEIETGHGERTLTWLVRQESQQVLPIFDIP